MYLNKHAFSVSSGKLHSADYARPPIFVFRINVLAGLGSRVICHGGQLSKWAHVSLDPLAALNTMHRTVDRLQLVMLDR